VSEGEGGPPAAAPARRVVTPHSCTTCASCGGPLRGRGRYCLAPACQRERERRRQARWTSYTPGDYHGESRCRCGTLLDACGCPYWPEQGGSRPRRVVVRACCQSPQAGAA
jgi:hypothetical protein